MAKKFFVALMAIIFFNMNTCAAENLKFIDSSGNDGYFIDMDTIKIESATVFSVNLAIVRLDSNQMDLIDLQINHGEKNYVIRSTRTLSYDERTEIKADYTPRSPKSYSEKSYLGDIVKIVIYGGE